MESVRNTMQVFRRELRSYFESPVAYVFLVVFLVMAGFFTFMISKLYEQGQADLRGFFFWHPWLYLILVPAASMRLWAEERRGGTLELLLTLPLTLTQAVVGKFLAAWCFLGIGLALTFPVVITVFALGSPDAGAIVGGYLGSLLLAGAYLAVGVLTSALTRSQVISFVMAVMICLFLLLAGWPPVTEMLVHWAPGWLVDGIAAFSVMPPFESFQRGVVDLRDVTYYAGVIVVMLAASHLALEGRKTA